MLHILILGDLLKWSIPPKDAVRIEEMINYFHYEYKDQTKENPSQLY
jgi:hypothetical protein